MSTLLFEADAFQKKDTLWHNESDGDVVVEHRQNVEDIVEWNKAIRNQHDGTFKGDMRLGFTIPTVIYEDLIRRGIAQDPDRFRKWMRSEEAKPWKVHPGRI